MNRNFNRQFILIDFRILDNREFLQFIGSSEFATYLILRRFVWRGSEPHYMGLNELYLQDKKLVCSLEREKITEVIDVRPNQVSLHLKKLEDIGVLERVRTGRQSIFVLGEWIDVYGDGSYKGLEWFYLEGKFGISKADTVKSHKSDVRKSGDQTSAKSGGQTSASEQDQTSAKSGDNNREKNREENTVNGGIQNLEDLDQPPEKTDYIAQYILDQLGDEHSGKFYNLVAAKIPEQVIRKALANQG